MKHLKVYEDINKKFKIGDIVVCNNHFYTPTDDEYEYSPKYGEKYIILGIKSHIFLSLKELKTNQYMESWNEMYFVSGIEWVANKYNL
jgi:hypothetical protein